MEGCSKDVFLLIYFKILFIKETKTGINNTAPQNARCPKL